MTKRSRAPVSWRQPLRSPPQRPVTLEEDEEADVETHLALAHDQSRVQERPPKPLALPPVPGAVAVDSALKAQIARLENNMQELAVVPSQMVTLTKSNCRPGSAGQWHHHCSTGTAAVAACR